MATSLLGVSHLHHKPHGMIGGTGCRLLANQLTCIVVIILCGGVASQGASTPTKTLYFQENVEPPVIIGNMALEGDVIDGFYMVLQVESGDTVAELPGNPKYSDLFDFTAAGNIIAKVKLDREMKSMYTLLVSIGNSEFHTVNIIVRDVNDNAPSFPYPVKNITVTENTRPDDQLSVLGSALDADAGMNSTQRYQIVSGSNGLFRLDETRIGNNDVSVVLKLNGTLDYESQKSYKLVVRAYDGADLFGDLTVNVLISDVNDMVPTFELSLYSAQVLENATIGQVVLSVIATDDEEGDYGVVEYALSSEDSSLNYNHFAVDSNTGEISVQHKLDYITQTMYRLRVVAKNPGATGKSSSAVVKVEVININDQAPEITVDYLYTGDLPEDLQQQTNILRLSINDPDQDGGNFTVELSDTGGVFSLDRRDRDTFFVVLSGQLDRETLDLYNMSVTAWDNGAPPLSKTTSVALRVADVNDNEPEFAQTTYTLETEELVKLGSPIGNITARDRDIGDNGRLTYSLLEYPGANSHWFTIHNTSGMVFTAREPIVCDSAASSPKFYVQATDHGTPTSKTSEQVLVTVAIRDLNNNQPVFDRTFYSVSVSESESQGEDIVQVTATDSDCGSNSELTYTLNADGVIPPTQFTVNPQTGVISLLTKLDYETKQLHEFAVMAVDRGGQMASVNVKVTVTDSNDNQPIFYPQSYAGNVRLNNDVGDMIIVVKATDADSGIMGNVSYFVIGGDGAPYFSVHQSSGDVKLKENLPLSPPDSYQLTINAKDGLNSPALAPADVSIIVIRDSTLAPIFTNALYQFSVEENSDENQGVDSVQALVQRESTGVTYSIFSGDPLGYFSIHPTSGYIRTTSVNANRERFDFLLLNVRAEKNGVYGNAQVNITITDVNDNTPVFTSTAAIALPIPEDTNVDVSLYTVKATDQDSGSNGRVRYQLTLNTNQMFRIHPVTGALSLKKQLDYESRKSYHLQVEAYDAGTPRLSNTLDISVAVQDVNDNPPVFISTHYELSLLELSPLLTEVGYVYATDADSGQNGKVYYHIRDNQTLFGILPSTGQLYNEVSFSQMERRLAYNLQIVATDGASADGSSTSYTATCTVSINIIDENDNIPRFSKSVFELSAQEDALPGQEIGQVFATDSDAGENSNLAFSLPADITTFRINRNNGKIYVKSAIDRETTPIFEFTVSVSDAGSSPNSAAAVVKVTVLDINDNAPRFNNIQNGVIPAYIYENKGNSTSIVQVTAVDADDGENKRVSYSITGDQSAKFAIDPMSGWLRARVTFDREVKSVYNVTVVARDYGVNPKSLSSSVTVMVSVLDKNEPPSFTAAYPELSTHENIPLGTVIGRVFATDRDQGENGQVHYTIRQSNPENVFDVNMTSGEIYSALPVDFEKHSTHWLIVQAVDSSLQDPQATNINVTITVIDRNDNGPVFDEDPKWINIVENTNIGDPIGQVTAHDGDSGENGKVIYEIVSQFPAGQGQGMFRINPKTGQISTATSIDYEVTSGVLLVIKATDQALNATERRHSTCSVVVNIKDINDNEPQFISRMNINLAEDESVGYPVLLVAAKDADRNDSIRYTITAGDPERKFLLNRDTGELKLREALDRETQATYNLSVKAIDTGNPPKHHTETIYITVTDVNDNAPRFTNSTYIANVDEEQTQHQQQVVRIEATDADEGANSKLTYTIPPGLADDMFAVDSNGMITTTAPLDREAKSIYTFSAYVHDDAYPKLYDWCTVTVKVNDLNDHTPYFLHRQFFQTVPENLRDRNTSIFQVIAQDSDEELNALISYSITMGNEDNKFSIDPQTGKIYAQSLDREQKERYTLTVQAADNGTPSRHNETSVIITISDTNDNDPQFTNDGANYKASLSESVSPGSFVLAIAATDPDKGNNSKITYYISSNGTDGTEGKFHLNMETGIITTSPTAGHFDREKKSSYTFRVTAQDNAQYDPRTKQTWVEITIQDVNDNAPRFDEVPFKKNITALAAMESSVLQLTAKDNDEKDTPNSQIDFSLVDGGEFFKVLSTGEIKVKQSLVGVTGVQQLKVRATDRGATRLHSDGYVEIRVGSSGGQQTFKFTSSSYTKELVEDARINALVLGLKASHTDGSRSGDVIYSMSGDVAEKSNPFSIGSLSGEIRVSDPSKLNFEDTQRYRIVVVAVSGDYTDYCTVWITVIDKNDNAPTFPQERYQGFVDESANVATYIAQVQATDKDGTQQNKEIEYRLQGEKAHYLHIGPKTGIIRLAETVDRETNEQIRATIIAQDKGNPSLSGSTVLRVTIRDANDNPPTFTNLGGHQANNPVMIKEDMQVGQEVYVVSALDADSAPALTFDFAPSGNPDHMFNIDHLTGRITLARELDHEVVNSYTLSLIANDSVMVVHADLYVSVTDENDNPPLFKETSYEVWIEELMPENSAVVQVDASDRDSGLNGRIKYSLQGAGADDFYINVTSGLIYNRRRIIYSMDKAVVNLAIKAADGGSPELNALVFVQIHIKDINNYAPVFSTTQSFSESVSEDEEIGVTVLSLSASDADDSPDNKRIEFSIVGGDPDSVFSMENQEVNIGSIVLKNVLDRESEDIYQLVIMASDGGTPSRNTTTVVNITVGDFNDWPPVFYNTDEVTDPASQVPMITVNLSEDIPVGSVVVQVKATDKDIGDNAVVEFMITSGNDDGLFQINQQSGVISLAHDKSLDYDIKQEHRMQVRATDSGIPRQSALATVMVNVSDVNDNRPRFIPLMYLENVKEKQDYGTVVFVAQAVDKDAGIYGVLTYALHGADAPNFKINPVTGQVITAIEFNFAGKKTYSFNVSATDLGGLTAVVQVQVQVLAFDGHKPVFTHASYKFEIPDLSLAYVGYEVGRVKAADQDEGQYGNIVYTLLNESYYFNVSRLKGIIAIKNPLTDNPPKSNQVKRDISSQQASGLSRHKRSLSGEQRLSIKAWSGQVGSQSSVVEVVIVLPGAGGTAAPTTKGPSTRDLIIIIVVVCLAVTVLVVVLIVKTMRNCHNVKREPQAAVLTQPQNMDSLGRGDTYGRIIPAGMAPPPYASYPPYGTSHDTDRSQCASSGRGSAEFDDDEGDEEISAINTVPLHVHQRAKMMPDSGIQRDTDTISEHSARDHQEYLARLGIDHKRIGGDKKGLNQSVESMHQFSDEGGGEADPLDISNLYNKLGDDGGGEDAAGENNINQMGFGEAPAQIGSLSSVTDASEEFTGSYNWDYLLNWGPQFQPLADVFAEIARLKDETIQPKRKPVQTIPQTGSIRTQPPIKLGGPPPIITATPPRVDSKGPGRGQMAPHEMTQLSSARTSQLTSMLSLPHSPVSHESSFSNLAFSPNFTPALSPLATRSPSVSTLQSNGSRSRSTQGSRSGHLGHHHMMGKTSSVATESDGEFRI